MAEQKILVFEKSFSYSGLLSVQGFYRHARNWLDEHGYGPYEANHDEQVFEDGKELFVNLQGNKKLSDYARIRWESRLEFINITDERVELEGQKVRMNKGSVKVTSMVILDTDWSDSWEQNAFQYFLRVVMDRFVFKSYISRAEKSAQKDYTRYEDELKRYLNMQEFR
jgi:hypothetical protein